MPPIASTGCADGVALSLRLSCDRCRAQKLKCSVPAGSQACQRCKRAKAPCVFGRRTPCKRRRRKKGCGDGDGDGGAGSTSPQQIPQQQVCSPAQQWSVTTPAGLATPPSPVALMSGPRVSGFTLDRELDAPTMAFVEPLAGLPGTMSEVDAGFFVDGPATWNCLSPGLQRLPPDTSGRGSSSTDTVGYERGWLQSGWPLGESAMLEFGQSDLALWSQQPEVTPINVNVTSTAHSLLAATGASDGRRKTGNNSAAAVAGQGLIQLVSEIQHQLRQLEEGPWHTDSASSLDDYPVGTVLALAKQFSALAGSILGCMGREQQQQTANDDATPTVLLVMCGYMWLVRIYAVVLGHFQRHLDHMPANQPDNAAAPCIPSASSPHALRLGELKCADATLGLQQIHTAVCMLLDALHDIESHLGCAGAVGRDMAVALLLKSGKSPEDSDASSSGGLLARKATAVKELLRRKMGL
ncbi:uncharacterized protein B0T15DRAFT_391055 [Chaetomium strumarium]|uniref:Zn(2)-C6 fungal-type domain-containing protein n=1 Tax=Chaetomium strumarium TaxID=1170767 RepID=A0AAJ0GXW3_9PEZI|nr:hypothetical protein B0T15DRAFT_391055 [Chaetomium strumarium]